MRCLNCLRESGTYSNLLQSSGHKFGSKTNHCLLYSPTLNSSLFFDNSQFVRRGKMVAIGRRERGARLHWALKTCAPK
jgi:hypothetical protein